MKKTLLSAFMLLSLNAVAQPEGRVFTIYNSPYANLTSPTVVTTAGWDDFYAQVPLGFNFTLMGQTTNKLIFNDSIGTGADLAMGNVLPGPVYGISLGMDLVDRKTIASNPASTVGYQTETVNGKKITKIQWRNAGFYGEYGLNQTLNDSINAQLWIYEGSNDVEVHYGKSSISSNYGDIFDNGLPLVAFIKNLNVLAQTLDYFYYTSSTNPPKVDSMDINQLMNATSLGISTYPTDGTVFKFAKPTNSVNGVQLNDYTKVYPSVITENCTVELSQKNFKGNVSVFDMNGKVVLNQPAAEGRNVLNLQQLPAGNYMLNIRNNEASVFYKIIKQ